MRIVNVRALTAGLALLILASLLPSLPVRAESTSRTFPETGFTVKDKFLDYWNNHGGLAQQGLPISEEMSETSETDGKIYTVQYFERAEFQLHPEFAGTSNEVLLSLLGVFRYGQKYPGGAPAQTPSNQANAQLFSQTGHKVGGNFLDYWNNHGGLAQQGLPISDEFIEVNELDGKPYKVQYFERAVFEYHPEFAGTANEVLLSQLGTFVLKQKQTPATATPAPAAPTAVPTNTPVPPAQPTATVVADCSQGVPDPQSSTITPKCGPSGTVYRITASGFTPNEQVSFWITGPDGDVLGTPAPVSIGNHPGTFNDSFDSTLLDLLSNSPDGIWALTYEGEESHHQAVVWFKYVSNSAVPATPTSTTPQSCDTSGDLNGSSTPSGGKAGTTLQFRAQGFTPGEDVSFWFTLPDGQVSGTSQPVPGGFVNSDGTIGPLPFTITSQDVQLAAGRWAITFEGASSHHQAVIYFCIIP